MDADRFDALAKALGLSAARRGLAAGLVSGALAAALASLETAARRHRGQRTHRDDDLSAEKRKKNNKKKCKKCGPCRSCKKGKCKPKANGTACVGGSCQGGACRMGDEAPPCTDESCPLPPWCSEQVFDACTEALKEALQADAEPCRSLCESGDNAACQDCLEPIVLARLPDAEACVIESCNSSAPEAAERRRTTMQASQAETRDWWQRRCEKPCCRRDYDECMEDARDAYLGCSAAALAALLGGPIAGGAAFALCLLGFGYLKQSCDARYGCATGAPCRQGDVCCAHNAETPCGETCCDLSRRTCCFNKWCCSVAGAACCTMTTGEEYCCDTGLACKQTGGPTCQRG